MRACTFSKVTSDSPASQQPARTGDSMSSYAACAGSTLGRGEAIRFRLPGGGHPFELFYDIDKPLAPEAIRSRQRPRQPAPA